MAHLRLDDRTTPDGKRVLFIEEIQSDWAQQGKAEGFKGGLTPEEQARKDRIDAGSQVTPEDIDWYNKRINDAKIPRAPFVQDTKAWVGLALKKAIQIAAQGDYDAISWATGEQQAERYNLSKQVRKIEWFMPSDTRREVSVYPLQGTVLNFLVNDSGKVTVADQHYYGQFDGKRLDEVVGKEVADKIMSAKGGQLTGAALSIGGTGMKSFYDQIVPQVASDVLRKLGGPRLTTLAIDIPQTDADAMPGFVLMPEWRNKILNEGMPLFSRSASRAPRTDLTPEQEALMHRMGADITRQQQSPRERWDAVKKVWATKANQAIFDRYRSFRDILKDDIAWMLSRLSHSSGGVIEAALTGGAPKLDAFGSVQIDLDARSMADITKKLGPEMDYWLRWIAGHRADRINRKSDANKALAEHLKGAIADARRDLRNTQSADEARLIVKELKRLYGKRKEALKLSRIRERYLSPDDIQALMALDQGTLANGQPRAALYDESRQAFDVINDAFVQLGVATGTIDEKEADRWRTEGMYVPFYRFMDEEKGSIGPKTLDSLSKQTAFLRYKGSARPLNDLLVNVISNWHHLADSALKNQAARKAVDSATGLGILQSATAKDGDLFVRVGGKKVFYKLADGSGEEGKLVLQSLLAMHFTGAQNPVLKFANKASRLLRYGVVASPAFKARNLVRDTLQALATVNVSYNPAKNVWQGWRATKPGGALAAQMLAAGGSFGDSGYFYSSDTETMRKEAQMLLGDRSVLNTRQKLLTLWNKYQDLGARLENVNRATAYQKTLTDTGGNTLRAAFEANDLLAFQAHGASPALYELTRLIPFLNARLQGLDKLARTGLTPSTTKRFLAVTGTYIVASVVMSLMMADDDDYIQAEEWRKDTYHLFKIPGSDVMWKIPRPFEMGAMASIAERVAQQISMETPDPKLFRQSMGFILSQQLAMNPVPQLFMPASEVWANKDEFTGRPIESLGMGYKPKADRFRPETPLIYRAASQGLVGAFGDDTRFVSLSPVELDHLVSGYTGWLGTWIIAGTDTILRGMMGEPSRPASARDVPFLGDAAEDVRRSFQEDETPRNTAFTSAFYDNLHTLEKVAGEVRMARQFGDVQRLEELGQLEGEKIQQVHAYRKAAEKLSRLNKMVEAIYRNETMDKTTKRARIDQINKQRNELSRFVVTQIPVS